MSLPDEQSAVAIFYKLKNLFFDENHDEEHIANVIRLEPIKTMGTVILLLTKSYNQKLNEIIEPLEEEKCLLLERLREAREQLQHSLEDNEFFKSKIDQLEEEKKQTEEKLNESIDHFERSREDILHEIDEREKIKSEVQIICKQAEEIFTENSQLKQANAEYEQQIMAIRQETERLKADNDEMLDINQEIRLKYHQAIRMQNKYCGDIQELQNRLHEREEFIASFIDEYNKVHLFNQESSAKEYHHEEKIEEENNELDGFNFNNFDRSSNISEKSLSKNSSLCNLEAEMDEKFQFVNATAEKVKPKIPISHTCVTDEKPARKVENKLSSNKQKQLDSKNKNTSNKVEMKKVSSNNKVNKTLIKTVSSKNLKLKESIMVSSSENEGSKMMEEMLKKKMVEKNQKIARLESEIKHLKEGFIQQRQKVTIMQGEYELQIEQLKEQLAFTKKELSSTYEKYSIANAECAVYQERIQEIEGEVVVMQEEHRSYCEELKRRCKEYVLKKIDQVENQCRNIKGEIKRQSAERAQNESCENHNESNDKLQYSIQSQQGIPQQFHLNLKQAQDQLVKIDSFSQIQSYQRLSNHYFNGFELQFSSKMSNMQPNHEQIYVQEQFDIESNLGGFTQRLVSHKKQAKLMRARVSLTDRCSLQSELISAINNHEESIQRLRLDCQVYEIEIDETKKQLGYANNLCQCFITPRERVLSFLYLSGISYLPQNNNKCLSLERDICTFTFNPVINELSLHHVAAFTYQPTLNLDFQSSIIHEIYVPRERKLQIVSNNLHITVKQQKILKLVPLQFIHIAQTNKQLKIMSKMISHNGQSFKHFVVSSMQTEMASKEQREIQTIVENSSITVQTLQVQRLNGASQVSISFNEYTCQTDHKSFFSQQTQTERQYKLSKKLAFGPQIINYSLQNASPNNKTMQNAMIYHEIAILQPSFCPFSIFSTPTTITSQSSNIPKQANKQINQKSCYEISQHSFQHESINHEESSYSETVSQIALKVMQENLSTKNDEIVVVSKLNEISGKNINIVYEASQKKRRSAEQRMSDFFDQIDHSNNYSILNNGALLSQNNQTKDGKTFNPESKSYRNQRVNQTQISISPWFVDQRKEPVDPESSTSKTLPVEVSSQLKKEQINNLVKYLAKHKLKLSFYNQIEKQAFKKPRDIKKKIYFIIASKNGQREVFMISSTRIQNIRNNQHIKFESNNVVDHVNFLFGQSEVMITGDSYLIMHRSGKKNKLLGNIQDGKWAIEFYITCTYQKMD